MSAPRYFRGGPSLEPRPQDVRIDLATGLLRPGRGVSVLSVPDGLERFGGAFEITNVPATLVFLRTGRNPHHYELAPAAPMTMAEYVGALEFVILVPFTDPGSDG